MSEQGEILVRVKSVGIFQGAVLRSRFHPAISAEVLPRRKLYIYSFMHSPAQIHPLNIQGTVLKYLQ